MAMYISSHIVQYSQAKKKQLANMAFQIEATNSEVNPKQDIIK